MDGIVITAEAMRNVLLVACVLRPDLHRASPTIILTTANGALRGE